MKRIKSDAQKQDLSFYTELPAQNLNYELFKEHAKDRLKVLRKVEARIKDTYTIKSMEEDLIGHSCLKLICCQSKWASIWFINMETQLFKNRIERCDKNAKMFFLEKFWPHLNISETHPEFIEYATSFNIENHNEAVFDNKIKVHFSKCSDLLAKRIHKLDAGYLLFNDDVMRSWLASEFKKYVTSRVDILYEQLVMNPDERFDKLAKDLFVEGNARSTVTKDALEKEQVFPLCMKGLMEKLRTQKYLKYNDRQALCLFLKDIGLPLNDTIHFFRTHFKASMDQFNKEYLYSIRHNYGLEGKRANYTSFTCVKLIGLANDPNTFGCPFVRNHEFVRRHADIEDFGKEAQKCCAKVGACSAGHELEGHFASPADYFRLVEKVSNELIK